MPLAVDGHPKGVDDPAQTAVAHRHTGGFQGSAHNAACADLFAVPEKHAAYLASAQVLYHPLNARGENQYFSILGVFQPAYRGNLAVHRQNMADLLGHHGQGPILHGLTHQRQ